MLKSYVAMLNYPYKNAASPNHNIFHHHSRKKRCSISGYLYWLLWRFASMGWRVGVWLSGLWPEETPPTCRIAVPHGTSWKAWLRSRNETSSRIRLWHICDVESAGEKRWNGRPASGKGKQRRWSIYRKAQVARLAECHNNRRRVTANTPTQFTNPPRCITSVF